MEPGSSCPRCAQPLAGEPACPRCGVIFAKLKDRTVRAAPELPAATPPETATELSPDTRVGLPWGLVVGVAALLIAGAVGLPRLRSPLKPAERSEGPALASGLEAPGQATAEDVPPPSLPDLVAREPISATTTGLVDADKAR